MNVLIIGENNCNNRVIEFFESKKIDTVIVTDVFSLRSLGGEAGDFTAYTKGGVLKGGEIKVDFIVITGQPAAEPVIISGLPTLSLYDEKEYSTPGSSEPVVFLLDYAHESPAAATITALNDAIAFSRNKRDVFYLAKFIRTAGRGVEELYKEAREAGVTFIKYENLDIESDTVKEEYTISVSDGEFDLNIVTKAVYTDGRLKTDERFDYTVKKLNLTTGSTGCLTGDMFYLTPALTSRRGVYHLTRDLVAECLDEGLEFIYSHAKSGIKDKPVKGTAEVDGSKCIFCCNCYRACPHAALRLDTNANKMECLSGACAGCGICAGLCPANAISLEQETNPAAGDEKSAKTLVLFCENSGGSNLIKTDEIEPVLAPCGGYIDIKQLTDGLLVYDKVAVVVCPDGACRHFTGNKRACAQISHLHKMLEAAGLPQDKVRIIQASQAMPIILQEELS